MAIIDRFVVVLGLAVLIAVLFFTGGCSTVREYGSEAVDELRKANDLALEASERAYCDGAVEGALVRRYGSSQDIQNARNELCKLIREKHYTR